MDNNSNALITTSSEKYQTTEEILDVKSLMTSFVKAVKNYYLYPENHSISQKSLITVKEHLDKFFTTREFLRFNVEENKLLFHGEVVHQDKPEEQSLAFPLFRDGIQWLEFRNGLAVEELRTFLSLLTKHRTIKEEAEDDLATALWGADLPHLHYKVDSGIWVSEPIVDFSSFKAGATSIQQAEEITSDSFDLSKKVNLSKSVADFMELDFMDENKIMAMIQQEESRDFTQDCLDILVIILREQNTEEDLLTIIDFLIGEIQYALSQCEFNYILKFLDSIDSLSQISNRENPMLTNLLADFRQRISSPEVLEVLEQAWPQVNVITDALVDDLRKFLLVLPPEVIHTLIPMLSRIRYPRIEKMFMEVIAVHAGRSLMNITELIDTIKESLIGDFITILGSVSMHNSAKLLFDLTRHSSVKVRECAINTLVELDRENLRMLFSLIEDDQPVIQHLICKHLGKQRSQMAEKLMLGYLKKVRFKRKKGEHILDCYRAFGRCASRHAIPFLQDILLKKDRKAFFGMNVDPHRQGAALSLLLMPKEWNTEIILHKAAKSLFHGVKRAYRNAEKEVLKTGRGV